jgi:hypothetical protein
MMAILARGSVLSSEQKPVMVKACCKLLGVWDRIWRFYGDEGAEDYSGQTQ